MQSHDPAARPLRATDWPWVQQWFTDPTLDRRLGPLDQEWLQDVLSVTDGVQLVIHTSTGQPVALMGCAWDPGGDRHAFTDVAVDPRRRGEGIGRRALRAAMNYHQHPPARGWLTFVEPDNAEAFAFFTRCGWQHEGLVDGMDRFTVDRPGKSA